MKCLNTKLPKLHRMWNLHPDNYKTQWKIKKCPTKGTTVPWPSGKTPTVLLLVCGDRAVAVATTISASSCKCWQTDSEVHWQWKDTEERTAGKRSWTLLQSEAQHQDRGLWTRQTDGSEEGTGDPVGHTCWALLSSDLWQGTRQQWETWAFEQMIQCK